MDINGLQDKEEWGSRGWEFVKEVAHLDANNFIIHHQLKMDGTNSPGRK